MFFLDEELSQKDIDLIATLMDSQSSASTSTGDVEQSSVRFHAPHSILAYSEKDIRQSRMCSIAIWRVASYT